LGSEREKNEAKKTAEAVFYQQDILPETFSAKRIEGY